MNLATSLANTVSHLTKISLVIDPMSVSEVFVARFKRELRNAAHATWWKTFEKIIHNWIYRTWGPSKIFRAPRLSAGEFYGRKKLQGPLSQRPKKVLCPTFSTFKKCPRPHFRLQKVSGPISKPSEKRLSSALSSFGQPKMYSIPTQYLHNSDSSNFKEFRFTLWQWHRLS